MIHTQFAFLFDTRPVIIFSYYRRKALADTCNKNKLNNVFSRNWIKVIITAKLFSCSIGLNELNVGIFWFPIHWIISYSQQIHYRIYVLHFVIQFSSSGWIQCFESKLLTIKINDILYPSQCPRIPHIDYYIRMENIADLKQRKCNKRHKSMATKERYLEHSYYFSNIILNCLIRLRVNLKIVCN